MEALYLILVGFISKQKEKSTQRICGGNSMMRAKQLLAETTKLPRNGLTSTPDHTVIQMVEGNHEVAMNG